MNNEDYPVNIDKKRKKRVIGTGIYTYPDGTKTLSTFIFTKDGSSFP